MDYIIADSVVIPTNFEKYYDEKVIRVPNSFFPYDDQQYRPSKSKIEARAIDGLPPDKFVFANFNRPQKNTLEDYITWAEILRKLPGSHILLYAKSKVAQANIIDFFNAQSISQDRIIFASYVQSRDEHFERLRAPDLMLDSFNYNGHTTTADALWSGLPVLTKMGNQFAARVSASLLRGLGLDELIVSNQIDYINKAITLANNPEYLIQIRQVLNSPQRNKNLFNTKDYTLRLEEAYENVISSNSTS
jgi:protein O-GlcNAc transferase